VLLLVALEDPSSTMDDELPPLPWQQPDYQGRNVYSSDDDDSEKRHKENGEEEIQDELKAVCKLADALEHSFASRSEEVFVASGNNVMKLMSMCYGLTCKADKRHLALFDTDPVYGNMHNKRSYSPTVPFLRTEVKRRAKLYKIKMAISTMPRTDLLEWLMEHPIENIFCQDYLQTEEEKIYKLAKAAQEEQANLAAERLRNCNWNSDKPWLRLYLAACDDSAREALLQKDQVKDRALLDIGNAENRPETYDEAVARVYNDGDLTLTTDALPNLHEKYTEPIILEFEDMPGGAINAEDVKARMGDARAKLIQVRDSFCFSFNQPLTTTHQPLVPPHHTDNFSMGNEWKRIWPA